MITNIPAQFRPRPYESPFQRQMPQFLMSMMGYYFQHKLGKEKFEEEFETGQFAKEEQLSQKLLSEGWTEYQPEEMGLRGYGGQPSTKADLTFKRTGTKLTRPTLKLEKLEKGGTIWKYGNQAGYIPPETFNMDRIIYEQHGLLRKDGKLFKPTKDGGLKEFYPQIKHGKPVINSKGDVFYPAFTPEGQRIKEYDLTITGAGKKQALIEQYEYAKEQGYKDSFTEWKKTMATAGASQINIGMEKLKIGKAITVGGKRLILTKGRQDKAIYGAEGPQFNNMNTQNEVAYWDSTSFDNRTKIIKLPQEAIAAEWTPAKVQNKANKTGMTVEQVLKEIGVLK